MPKQRIATPATLHDRAFAGRGASLYATTASRLSYRRPRIVPRGKSPVRGTSKDSYFQYQATTRVAKVAHPDHDIDWPIPADFADSTVLLDVRHFKDDVENESDNFRPLKLVLDSNRDRVQEILGTATLLDLEQRAGGVVRLRFVWEPARDGEAVAEWTAIATDGPTSPANVTVSHASIQRIVEIDTPALEDSSPYTYKIQAANSDGTVTKDVLTGITVEADATGPPAPEDATTSAV